MWDDYESNVGSAKVIDVGCAALIIDGRVKVKHGVEIDHLKKDSVVFTDGTELEADAIILAYCYFNSVLSYWSWFILHVGLDGDPYAQS